MSLQILINLIISHYFTNKLCLTNIYETTNYTNINQTPNIPIYNLSPPLETQQIPPCNNFLLNIQNPIKTLHHIEEYIRKNSTNSYYTRKYLIIWNTNKNINLKSKIFTFIADLLIIKPNYNQQYLTNYEIYKHNYHTHRHGNTADLINKWYPNNSSFLWTLDHHLNTITTQKFQGRKFINAYVNNPPYIDINGDFKLGSEYKAMQEFAKYSNMTFSGIMFKKWGDYTNNWNATTNSVKSAFLNDEVDVYYSSAILTSESLHYASLTNPFLRMSFKCLVPTPKENSDWLLALNIKSYKFWLLLNISYMAIGLLVFVQKLRNEEWIFNCLEFYGVILSQSVLVKDLPKKTLMRIIFVELFSLSILFGVIYNSHMSSVITLPKYTGRISTIEDMIQYKLRWTAPTLGYAIPLKDYNKNLYDLFFLSTRDELLQFIKRDEYLGFGFIELNSRYYDLKNFNIPQIENYNVLKDEFIIDFTYFHLRKNSFLLEPMNEFLLRVTESGLHVYWETESYFARNLLLLYARLKDSVDQVLRPLSVDKLKGHFVIWFIGVLISMFCFIYEVNYANFYYALQ